MNCQVIEKYFSSVRFLLEEEKVPKKYGGKELLYPFEMKMINAVKEHAGANAVDLSQILGVTKGAITQYGNKLEEKGIVIRHFQEGNKKEKYYKLTTLGDEIYEGYQRYYQDGNKKICQYLSGLNHGDREIIMDFLEEVKKTPITTFVCKSNHCLLKGTKTKP